MILILDTETTGLPLGHQPRLVQIAWLKFDYSKNLLSFSEHIIKPTEFVIPKEAAVIHGITTNRAYADGVNLQEVLVSLSKELEDVRYIVGHNLEYDLGVLNAEYQRLHLQTPFPNKEEICLMRISTDFCRIPGQKGFKWPSLSELYFKLFNCSFQNAHSAKSDVIETARCFWEMKTRGLVDVQEIPKISVEHYIALHYRDIGKFSRVRRITLVPAGDYEVKSIQVIDKYGMSQEIYEIIYEGEDLPIPYISSQLDVDEDINVSLFTFDEDVTLNISNKEVQIQRNKTFFKFAQQA